jgi:hypothetical protein
MADDAGSVTEQVFEPSPARAQTPFGEHYPWIFTFFGEDVLEVTSWNSASGVRLRISGRVHRAPGEIVPFSATHTPNTDRTALTTIITMPLGELLNAIVWAEAGSPQAGQTFVRIAVRRGAGAAFERLGVIIQGQVTANTARAFPGSAVQSPLELEPYLRFIVGTTPAVGAPLGETVPTGVRWEIMNWSFQLATSSVAHTMLPYFQCLSPVSTVALVVHTTRIPNNAIYFFSMSPNLAYLHDTTEGLAQMPLPQRLVLLAGETILTGARNQLSGDAFNSLTYQVREWLDI